MNIARAVRNARPVVPKDWKSGPHPFGILAYPYTTDKISGWLNNRFAVERIR
jgi:hypothetical protein